jgi:AbrB family looped-hinge helix DNA binding protein
MVLFYVMKKDTIHIDKAGRIVLPKRLRERFDLLPGDKLRVSIEGNSIKLEPAEGSGGFVRKGTVLVFRGLEAPVTAQEVGELIDQTREERFSGAKSGSESK